MTFQATNFIFNMKHTHTHNTPVSSFNTAEEAAVVPILLKCVGQEMNSTIRNITIKVNVNSVQYFQSHWCAYLTGKS